MASKGEGKSYKWIQAHVDYPHDEFCLIWPYARDKHGRGLLGANGKSWWAHRLMCTLVKGEPPTPKHTAAHNCGKGHDGCVNPRHLEWKTQAENMEDCRRHGTLVRHRGGNVRRLKKRPSMGGTRRALFNKCAGLCAYCRRKTEMPSVLPGKHHALTATIDHIVPLCRGGAMRGDNITLACSLCNGLKGNMAPQEWTEFMMANPEWWRRSKGKTVIPMVETQMILREGKLAWKKWRAAKKAPAAAFHAMTAEENERRVNAYWFSEAARAQS